MMRAIIVIIVIRVSEVIPGSGGSVKACRPTTKKKSLSPGVAVDCNLTHCGSHK